MMQAFLYRCLSKSRQREQEEESLRKQLIANLSHDLRNPLTIIRSDAYSLKKEPLSEKGKASVSLIETKSDDLNRLIDNLLSYTLLSAGKYPLQLAETDVIRLFRSSAAAGKTTLLADRFTVVLADRGQFVPKRGPSCQVWTLYRLT